MNRPEAKVQAIEHGAGICVTCSLVASLLWMIGIGAFTVASLAVSSLQ